MGRPLTSQASILWLCLLACCSSSIGDPRAEASFSPDAVLRDSLSSTDSPSAETEPKSVPHIEGGLVEAREPVSLSCIRAGYGDYIRRVEKEGETLYVVMSSGARLVFDDGADKTFEERLASPDLEDQMSIPYPLDPAEALLAKNDDPGRIRHERLFKAV